MRALLAILVLCGCAERQPANPLDDHIAACAEACAPGKAREVELHIKQDDGRATSAVCDCCDESRYIITRWGVAPFMDKPYVPPKFVTHVYPDGCHSNDGELRPVSVKQRPDGSVSYEFELEVDR